MDHFLHEIEITNFKSIRHQKIEGCRRINVFIGYPNVGKSNVLEALSTLVYLEGRHKDNVHISDLVRLNDSFNLLFFDVNKEAPATVQFSSDKRVAFYYKNRDELQFMLEGWVTDSVSEDRWSAQGGISFRQQHKFGDYPVSNVWQPKPAVKKYSFVQGRKFNREGDLGLAAPFGDNLFFTIETKPALRREVADLFASYNLKLLFNKAEEYDFSAMKLLGEESYFPIPFSQIADTLQRLIFHKAAIASNKDSVLLFEEPEAHMFPPYISKFTADVMFDENDNQFFINTHSPFVINDFMENLKGDQLAIFVVGFKKETGETVVRKLSDEELHEIYQYGIDLYLNLESYLEHEEQ